MPSKIEIEYRAAVNDAVADIEKVNTAVGESGSATEQAGLSLTDLKSGLDLAVGAYKAVEGAVKSVIDPTVAYAAEVRDLGRTIGSTAEESSKLIQAADDVGVSAGTLQAALQAAIRKGVKPSIEGIGELADEYNAIQDPIARTKFLMDNFGRSGAALAPLMEQGAAGIAAAGDEAERLGLVMSQDGVDSARQYEIAMDNFNDSVLAAKLAIAEGLLPALGSVINQASEYVQVWKNVTEAIDDGTWSLGDYLKASAEVVWTDKTLADVNAELTNKQSEQNAVVEAAAARYQGLADQYTTSTIPATVEYSNQIQSQTQWLNELAPAIDTAKRAGELLAAGMSGALKTAFEDFQTATANTVPVIADNAGWLETMTAKQVEAEAQLRRTTAEFLFQQVAASLTKEAQLELANSLGLIDDASYDAALAMQDLTTKYDTNHDGVVDAKEATADYKNEVIALRDTIAGMADKTVNIRVNTVYSDSYLDEYRAATGSGRASGGPVRGGGAYVVGENGPEPFFPATDGYVMNNQDGKSLISALEAIAAALAGGAGATNHYYGYGDGGMDAGERRAMAGALA